MTDQPSDLFRPSRRGERAIHITLIASILVATVSWNGFLGWELAKIVGWL